MDFKGFLLSEMMVHRLGGEPYRNFIAFRGHLWLFDDEPTQKEAKAINRIILKEHPQHKELKEKHRKFGKYSFDIQDWVRENIQDAFVGSWDAKTKIIWTGEDSISPVTSPLVKKVVAALKAKSVQFETNQSFSKEQDVPSYQRQDNTSYWDRTEIYRRKDILGQIPETAFHGTSTKYLPDILKWGLMPGQAESNYGDIMHEDKIFLAFKFSEAESHATHTGGRTKNYPVVIQVKIPDRARLLPDYDADKSTSTPTYPDFVGGKPNTYSSVSPMKASKHQGVVGYKGRIPANFIEAVYLRMGNNWKKVKLDTLRKRVAEDPWEWQYKYGFE
ncbi:MAG: hypothetical protein M0R80_02880 [Proteobacteria bacterium]|jgi:hypothetical protein|nr:hypothetical protein [Pseudomonadota bacterium]